MADHKEKERVTKRRRMWFMLSVLGLFAFFVLFSFFYLPKYDSIYTKMGIRNDLPLPSVFLMNLGQLFLSWWWVAGIGSLVLCFLASQGLLDPLLKLLITFHIIFFAVMLLCLLLTLRIPGEIQQHLSQ